MSCVKKRSTRDKRKPETIAHLMDLLSPLMCRTWYVYKRTDAPRDLYRNEPLNPHAGAVFALFSDIGLKSISDFSDNSATFKGGK